MRWLIALLAACGDNLSLTVDAAIDAPTDAPPDRLLMFTRTLGYRHADSIAIASQVLPARLAKRGVERLPPFSALLNPLDADALDHQRRRSRNQ